MLNGDKYELIGFTTCCLETLRKELFTPFLDLPSTVISDYYSHHRATTKF